MTAVIQHLIDKQDTFEIVRDKVALILAEESAQPATTGNGRRRRTPPFGSCAYLLSAPTLGNS